MFRLVYLVFYSTVVHVGILSEIFGNRRRLQDIGIYLLSFELFPQLVVLWLLHYSVTQRPPPLLPRSSPMTHTYWLAPPSFILYY